ncbi:MAG: helix-turn-helix domain-containing protein [Flammeovirgaceae bacterium]
MKNFGENIRIVRQAKGYSQENVAELLEMSPSGYAKIERGESDSSVSRIEEIAKVFEVEPAQLISMTDKSFIFNIKKNHSSPIGNIQGGTFHFQNDSEELSTLLKKTLESLTQLVESVVRKTDKGQ